MGPRNAGAWNGGRLRENDGVGLPVHPSPSTVMLHPGVYADEVAFTASGADTSYVQVSRD